MYASDWERLGIGPTRDIPTIKRAYALQLRSTRPDDDAQAYQALREAYERAQYWARHIPDEDDEAGDEAEEDGAVVAAQPEAVAVVQPPEPAPPEAAVPAAPPAEDDAWQHEAELPDDETPEALVDRSYRTWREQGTEALLAGWPAIESALDRLPLNRRPEASARFADLVISVEGMPSEFVRALATHFTWLGDFRIDRMIGPARAEALRQTLGDLIVPAVNDPQVLRHFADLRCLHRLLQRRWPVHAWLHAALVGWPLSRQMAEAGPRLLRGLGMEPDDQKRLGQALDVALWLRVFLMAALLLGACAFATDGRWGEAVAATATVAMASVAVLGASLIVGTKLSDFLGSRAAQSDGLGRWFHRQRSSRAAPWIGLAAGAASVGLYAWAAVHESPLGPWAVGALFSLASVAFFWPLRPDLGVVAAATWGFLVACLMRIAPAGSHFFVMVGAAGLATLVAVQHAEGRWEFPLRRWAWVLAIVVVQFVRHAEQGALAFWVTAGLCSIAATLLTLSRATLDGYRSALLPMALAAGVAFALDESRHSPVMLYAWCIACVGVMCLQLGARWLDRRAYGRVADSD